MAVSWARAVAARAGGSTAPLTEGLREALTKVAAAVGRAGAAMVTGDFNLALSPAGCVGLAEKMLSTPHDSVLWLGYGSGEEIAVLMVLAAVWKRRFRIAGMEHTARAASKGALVVATVAEALGVTVTKLAGGVQARTVAGEALEGLGEVDTTVVEGDAWGLVDACGCDLVYTAAEQELLHGLPLAWWATCLAGGAATLVMYRSMWAKAQVRGKSASWKSALISNRLGDRCPGEEFRLTPRLVGGGGRTEVRELIGVDLRGMTSAARRPVPYDIGAMVVPPRGYRRATETDAGPARAMIFNEFESGTWWPGSVRSDAGGVWARMDCEEDKEIPVRAHVLAGAEEPQRSARSGTTAMLVAIEDSGRGVFGMEMVERQHSPVHPSLAGADEPVW